MNRYLNEENIARSTAETEFHPLHPFLPADARVLFLGSFPPPRHRWCMDFYYPNFINDHWRIEGAVFYNDKDYFVDAVRKTFRLEAIVDHCTRRGLAFYDTATAVRRLRDNASDQYLEVVEPTDIRALMERLPRLRAIATTGEKATETICRRLGVAILPDVNAAAPIPSSPAVLYRLPSSSRAYPLALEQKVEAYKRFFDTYLQP